MRNYQVLAILSYLIFLAAIIGAIRFKRILKSYRPFIFFVWTASLNEIASTICIGIRKNNHLNLNIYVIIEYLLILLLFIKWDYFKRKRIFYNTLLIIGCIVWILDNLVFHSLDTNNSFFKIFYSIVLVYLSVEEINNVIFNKPKNLLRNAKFIICVSFLIFFTYSATFYVIFFWKPVMSNNFYQNVFFILVFVNLFINIIYALVMLCMPTKQEFTLPY